MVYLGLSYVLNRNKTVSGTTDFIVSQGIIKNHWVLKLPRPLTYFWCFSRCNRNSISRNIDVDADCHGCSGTTVSRLQEHFSCCRSMFSRMVSPDNSFYNPVFPLRQDSQFLIISCERYLHIQPYPYVQFFLLSVQNNISNV